MKALGQRVEHLDGAEAGAVVSPCQDHRETLLRLDGESYVARPRTLHRRKLLDLEFQRVDQIGVGNRRAADSPLAPGH